MTIEEIEDQYRGSRKVAWGKFQLRVIDWGEYQARIETARAERSRRLADLLASA